MMESNRDTIRATMNASFATLPEWLRAPFLPMRENLTLLFDLGRDELAREVIEALPHPAGWTQEQLADFDQAKAGILAGIDALIADAAANDPLRSPEAVAMAALAAERRAQG